MTKNHDSKTNVRYTSVMRQLAVAIAFVAVFAPSAVPQGNPSGNRRPIHVRVDGSLDVNKVRTRGDFGTIRGSADGEGRVVRVVWWTPEGLSGEGRGGQNWVILDSAVGEVQKRQF
jgi:hypothetical protein